jgi:hypothetical protein
MADWWSRPLRRAGLVALVAVVCLVPAWLFADPLAYYSVYGDDWEFVASSRTFARAWENLWKPHNVHVVPAWRLWTAVVVAGAGRLQDIQPWLAGASYAVHVAVMLLAGRLVARETRRPALAVATMVFLGTSALMQEAATWFSASQASGAAFGVLMTLWYAQGWRRAGGWWRLIMIVVSTWLAGGCWTTGHVAGPIGAAYLLADGRRRCRVAALVPMAGTAVAVYVALTRASKAIAEQSTISFHGRKTEEAVAPIRGLLHTVQAVPERLLLGDLGLVAETTLGQAVVVLLGLAVLWLWTRRGNLRPNPLECAGLVMTVVSYAMLWTFRGYLPFSSLRGFMPWYETIPHVGLSLFLAGWWSGVRGVVPRGSTLPLTRAMAVGLLFCQGALVVLHQPRSQALFEDPFRVPMMVEMEKRIFPIPLLRRLRAAYFWNEAAHRQRRHLARLDHAQEIARQHGVGREVLVREYGRVIWTSPPEMEDANLLDLPWKGSVTDPQVIRRAFGKSFDLEPTPPAPWMVPNFVMPKG